MEVINVNSNCPNCGAPVDFEKDSQAFICKYCSSVIAIIPPAPNQATTEDTKKPVLRKVEPEVKYKANHNIGSNSQGGHLWITKDEVVFKPHSLNFGPLGKRYIRIQDVVGYEKGFLTNMTIYTKNGYQMDLVVWKKDEIINEIESRRVNYFESQGLPVPPLECGDQIGYYESTSDGEGDGAVPADQLNTKAGCLGVIVAFIVSIGTLLYSIV
jgi:DNA-directed RNA polymerase subunit RPC12/RpoP